MSGTLASLKIMLGMDSRGVSEGVRKTKNDVNGLTGMIKRNANLATAAAGAAVGNFLVSATGDFVKFDDGMRQIFTLLPGISKEAMDSMKADVRGLAKEFGTTTEDVIPGMYDALSSGIPKEALTGFMKTATMMGVAGVATTQQSVALLAQLKNAYRLNVEDMAGVSDDLFQAVNIGVTTIPELGAALSGVTPMASAMGISIKEVLAAISQMTLAGSSTGEAVTNMQATLTALQKPLPLLSKGLKDAGFASGQAAIDALGYQGAMELVRDISVKLGVTMPMLTGRIQATTAVLQLTGENAESARVQLDKLQETGGMTADAFKTMNEGVGGAVRRMQAQVKDFALSVGEFMAPVAPLMMAFGPTLGQWIGRGVGAGFALSLKGLAGVAKRLMPQLTNELMTLGEGMGGGMGRGMLQGIKNSMKSAGWKKIMAGMALMVGGEALKTVAGQSEDTGIAVVGQALGSGAMIAGAFAIGGPVLAMIVAVEEAVTAFLGFMDGVNKETEAVYTQMDTFKGTMPSVAELEASIAKLKNMPATLGDVGSAVYGLADLTQGTILSGFFGNVAETNEKQIAELERMLVVAKGSLDHKYTEAATPPPVPPTADDLFKTQKTNLRKLVTGISGTATKVTSAWDTLGAALAKGPKLQSYHQMMVQGAKRVQHDLRQLARAIAAHDPNATSFWTQQLLADKAAQHSMQNNSEKAMGDGQALLDRYGQKHGGANAHMNKSDIRRARIAAREGLKAGQAPAKGLEAGIVPTAAAAGDVATAATTPVSTVPNDFANYGTRSGGSFAASLAATVPQVETSSQMIANAARKFVHFSSPPPGPLHDVDKWGEHFVIRWIKPVKRHLKDVEHVGTSLANALFPKKLRWNEHFRNIRKLMHAGKSVSDRERHQYRTFMHERMTWEKRYRNRHDGSSGGAGRGSGSHVSNMRVQTLRVEHLRLPGWGRGDGAGGGSREVNHWHIGTLIANDKGIDELDRRMTRRRRLRRRDRRLINEPN